MERDQNVTLRCEYPTNDSAVVEVWNVGTSTRISDFGDSVHSAGLVATHDYEIAVSELLTNKTMEDIVCRLFTYNGTVPNPPVNYNFTRFILRSKTEVLTTTAGEYVVYIHK